MSIETDVHEDQIEQAGACTAIDLMIVPRVHELGGFSVRRALPSAKQRMVGPWIFFDHMGPATFEPGHGVDDRPHPHINLATVTYLFEGKMLHRDSLGNELAIRPGEINLMVAGGGSARSRRCLVMSWNSFPCRGGSGAFLTTKHTKGTKVFCLWFEASMSSAEGAGWVALAHMKAMGSRQDAGAQRKTRSFFIFFGALCVLARESFCPPGRGS